MTRQTDPQARRHRGARLPCAIVLMVAAVVASPALGQVSLHSLDPFAGHQDATFWRQAAAAVERGPVSPALRQSMRTQLAELDSTTEGLDVRAAARWILALAEDNGSAAALRREAAAMDPLLALLVEGARADCAAHPVCVGQAVRATRGRRGAGGSEGLEAWVGGTAHERAEAAALLEGARARARAGGVVDQAVGRLAHDGWAHGDARLASIALERLMRALDERDGAAEGLAGMEGPGESARGAVVAHAERRAVEALAERRSEGARRWLATARAFGAAGSAHADWWLAAGAQWGERAGGLWWSALGARERELAERARLLRLRRADRDGEALARVEALLAEAVGAEGRWSAGGRAEVLEACVVLGVRRGSVERAEACVLALEALLAGDVRWDGSLAALRTDVGLAWWRAGEVEAARWRLKAVVEEEGGEGFHAARAGWWWAETAGVTERDAERRRVCGRVVEAAPLSIYGRAAQECGGLDGLGWLAGRTAMVEDDGDALVWRLHHAGLSRTALELAEWTVLELGLDAPGAAALLALHMAAGGDAVRLARLEFEHVRLQERSARELLPFAGVVLEALHPSPWGDEIRESARVFGVEPSLVLAVMRRESAFRSAAISPVGARGLMQVRPATATFVHRVLDLGPAPTRTGLLDAERNIRTGAAALAWLGDRFGGCTVRVAAAYSTGHGRVAGWDRRFGESDALLWIELVPYPVVRHYIRDIVTTSERYDLLLARAPEEGVGSLEAEPR